MGSGGSRASLQSGFACIVCTGGAGTGAGRLQAPSSTSPQTSVLAFVGTPTAAALCGQANLKGAVCHVRIVHVERATAICVQDRNLHRAHAFLSERLQLSVQVIDRHGVSLAWS